MRCRRFFILFIAILAALLESSVFVVAQSAIKPMKDLSVGNRWVYQRIRTTTGTNMGVPDNSSDSFWYYEEVLRDSVFENNRYSQVFNSYSNSSRWERSDSNSLYIWDGTHEIVSIKSDSSEDIINISSVEPGAGYFPQFRNIIHLRYIGTFSNKVSYKLQTSVYLGNRIGFVPGYNLDIISEDKLLGAKLRDSIWGDTTYKMFSISVAPETYLRPNSIVSIPLRLTGIRFLNEVYATPPIVVINFNRNAIECTNLASSNFAIDSSGLPINTILRITPSLDSSFPTLQFRMRSSTTETSASLKVSLQGAYSVKPCQYSVQSGTIIFTRPSYDVLSYLFPPKQAIQGSTINIVGVLIGTRDAAEYGIKRIQTTLKIPTFIAQPEGAFTISNGFYLVPMNFVLSTDANTATSEVRLRVISNTDTTASLELINSLAIPNAANFNLIANTTTLHIIPRSSTKSTVATSSLLDISQSLPIILEQISPNPAKDEVSISYSLRTDTALEITLFDIQGNKIHTLMPTIENKVGAFTLSVRTDNLASGQYRLVFQTPSGSVQAQVNVIR
jgi:hypothetical protein